ncbi:methionyl-tRNA formyltransferase [Microdochium nivale]|nr:methionyl-tRNA formyltransferase [Microdochium nivale]
MILCVATARRCITTSPQPALKQWLSSSRYLLYPDLARRQHSKINAYSTASSSTAQAKRTDPLRVLFCGSDEFSCASLDAIYREHRRNPDIIQSIDVVVRPGKPTGRGLKVIRQPPLQGLASSLGLSIHERDTFTGWDMPQGINLIIAVSFGLFVPPRLLRAAKYGGINVHPSLLPDLRGPAPLQHTLLLDRRFAGVTLQTLDHQTFDHGLILTQTPAHALLLPKGCTFQQLHDLVAPVGADMLVRGLREGLHVPPLLDVSPAGAADWDIRHAPKIRKEQRQITPSNLSIIVRSQRAIGPMWFLIAAHDDARAKAPKRVIVHDLDSKVPRALQRLSSSSPSSPSSPGEPQEPPEFEPVTLTLAYEDTTVEPTPANDDINQESTSGKRSEHFKHVHLNAWVRSHHPSISSKIKTSDEQRRDGEQGKEDGEKKEEEEEEEEEDDRDYIYLPKQGCRIKHVTVEGGKRLPARLALAGFLGPQRETMLSQPLPAEDSSS